MDASGLLTGLALALTGACIYLHLRLFSYWSSRGVRGPTPWPVFGTNIYYLFGSKLDVDLRWRQKYGKTYGLYEGYSPLLRTTDNELIKQIYIKKFNSFTDRHNEFINSPRTRNWLLWSEGQVWANQRALVSPMFSSARMRQMLGAMSACVDRFMEEARRRLASTTAAGPGGEKIFKKRDLSNMTLDVIATTFFGLKLDPYGEKAQNNEFLKQAIEFTKLSLGRFLAFLMIPRQLAKRLEFDIVPDTRFDYFHFLTKSIIDERRRSGGDKSSAKNHQDFVQLFLDAKIPEQYEQVFSKEDNQEAHYNDQQGHEQLEEVQRAQTKSAKLFRQFTDLEIRGQMTFMFLAGFETTANTIAMCVFELAHQPATQARLYAELESALGRELLEQMRLANLHGNPQADSKFPADKYSDLIGAPLLDAFVSETLRLYSPLVEFNRRATEPAELVLEDGRTLHLPRGLPISTNGFIVQREPDYFEAADEFRLERFLPENRHKIKTCTFMPFGLGPRHCVGMRFALLEVKLALVKLLASYSISPGPRSTSYPPKFQRNPIFLLLEHTDFKLEPRAIANPAN